MGLGGFVFLGLNFSRRAAGFSLIEALLAVVIVGGLVLVLANIFTAMGKNQTQLTTQTTVQQLMVNVERAISNSDSWSNMIKEPLNADALGCLDETHADYNKCEDLEHGVPVLTSIENYSDLTKVRALPRLMVIKDGNNADLFNASVPNRGFRRSGENCDTFQTGVMAQEDNCPFSMEVRVALKCPGVPNPCPSPDVTVYAIPIYSPGSPNSLPFSEIKNSIVISRGTGKNFKSQRLVVQLQTISTNPVPGTCSGWTPIPFEPDGVASEVTGVTLPSPGTVNVPSGKYTCSASGTCFGCGSLRVRLSVNGAIVTESPSVLVPNNMVGQALIHQTPIDIVGATGEILVEQYCHTQPNNDPSMAQFGFGMPLEPYVKNIFATLNCIKVF